MYELYSLEHHGIKGQQWGVRRYQNEDGSLTSQGKERYYTDDGEELVRKSTAVKTGVISGIAGAVVGGTTVGVVSYFKNKKTKNLLNQKISLLTQQNAVLNVQNENKKNFIKELTGKLKSEHDEVTAQKSVNENLQKQATSWKTAATNLSKSYRQQSLAKKDVEAVAARTKAMNTSLRTQLTNETITSGKLRSQRNELWSALDRGKNLMANWKSVNVTDLLARTKS